MCNFRIEYFICSMFIYYILYYSPLIKKKRSLEAVASFPKGLLLIFLPFLFVVEPLYKKKKNNNSPSMNGKGNYQ